MNLLSLFDLTTQFQNKNGAILTSGKLYVYYLGRTQFAITYKDANGEVVNPNPIILDNNGRAPVFVDSDYSYTLVVCDPYGEELFSQDITPCGTQGGAGGQGKTYYGGNNIEITQQNYINVTGRKTLAVMNPLTAYEDSNRCVIAIKDGTFLNPSSLDTKLDTTAFSTVSGNFLTAHQSLDGYLTSGALNGYATVDWTSGMLSQKLDITAYQADNGGDLYQDKAIIDFSDITATLANKGAVVPLTTYMNGVSTWRFSNSGTWTDNVIGFSGEVVSGVEISGYTFTQLQPNGVWRDLKISGADIGSDRLLTGYNVEEITAFASTDVSAELEVSGGWGPGTNDGYHSCTYMKDYIIVPQKNGKYPKAFICNFDWASTDGYLSFFPCEQIGYNGTRSTAYSYDSSQYINDGFGDSNMWKNVCLNFTANSAQKMAYVAIKGGDGQSYSAKNVKYTCFY